MQLGRIGLPVASAVFLLASPALSLGHCKPRIEALELLNQLYGEAPVAIGVTNKHTLLEVTAASNGKQSWTIIITTPDGLTCMIVAGEGWRAIAGPGQGTKM